MNNITIIFISLLSASVVNVNFTQPVYVGIESDLSVAVCVFIVGGLERDVKVGVITTDFIAEGIFLIVYCAS